VANSSPSTSTASSTVSEPTEQLTPSDVELIAAERLTFFSDAVVAIAITLLALDLPVPAAPTNPGFLHEVRTHSDAYVAFLISFTVIGSHWFGHHRMFRYVTRLGGRLVALNRLWLLMIVLMPFATKVLIGNGAFQARFTFYAAVQALTGLFFLLTVRAADRNGLFREDTPARTVTETYLRMSVFIGAFAVSIPVAFLTRWAYVCWIAIPFAIRGVRMARTGRRRRQAVSAGASVSDRR